MSATLDPHAVAAADIRAFTTRDGQRLALRHVRHDDAPALTDLLLRLSARTRQLRYHVPRHFSLDEAWGEVGRIYQHHRGGGIALVAVAPRPWGDDALAVAELAPDPHEPTTGHLAIVVRDDYQARGIGVALLGRLLEEAREGATATLHATIFAENVAARRLLDRLAPSHFARTRDGVLEARLSAKPSAALRSAT